MAIFFASKAGTVIAKSAKVMNPFKALGSLLQGRHAQRVGIMPREVAIKGELARLLLTLYALRFGKTLPVKN